MALPFSHHRNPPTPPDSRQQRNQYCRNQYDSLHLAILSFNLKAVQCKMSNQPLGFGSGPFEQQAPRWMNDARAGRSGVRGEGSAKGWAL